MAYDDRKLTPEERHALVNERLSQGHPRHAPPHPYPTSGWFLLTAANYEHKPIMNRPERRQQFQALLLEEYALLEAEKGSYVVLPNHYHVLAAVSSFEQVSQLCQRLHGRTSRLWNGEDGTTGKRRVWYRYADRRIRNERHYLRVLNYIHFNPVKHGYVDSPYDWPTSSVHWYVAKNGRKWLRSTWRRYPPLNMGKGWDD